ncbi:histone-lysine N-methyltransferase SETMAR-like [Bactrocera tryoni]|uniref:histone-lysine N-methyltransferase SETMAR-like n=1 Tax=Bactrocera tryoni TaxID=59916 RepID=UPI001A99AB22|nr:histone-lysine N-methyltransferase SETMAR-like [Bactrocera tryoni]
MHFVYQNVMKRIITVDESWIYAYDPETDDQSDEYRDKGEPNRSKIKVVLTVFFGYRGVIHSEFLPTDQAINKEYYLNFRKTRPELWADNSWFLYHVNASLHTALIPREFFTKSSINIVPQPPFSPDLAQCDF